MRSTRAFFFGESSLYWSIFEHRRGWILDRLEFLTSVFGIDCLTYTVLSNHLHIVLRSRADVVATWSVVEVARRWLKLFPIRRKLDGSPATPTKPEIDMIFNHPEVLAQRRRRLSDVSWWMRCTAENIARRANREDDCTGRFLKNLIQKFVCFIVMVSVLSNSMTWAVDDRFVVVGYLPDYRIAKIATTQVNGVTPLVYFSSKPPVQATVEQMDSQALTTIGNTPRVKVNLQLTSD